MRAVLMSVVMGAMVLTSAVAQAAPSAVQQDVKVPFSFVVNGQELPAGTYSIRRDDAQPSALLIQSGRESVYVLTTPVANASARQDSSLVFAKDGDRYRLAEVWSDAGDGVQVVNR
jgi:hypothetical protein